MNAHRSDSFDGPGTTSAPTMASGLVGLLALPVLILCAGIGGYYTLLYFKDDPQPRSSEQPPPLVETEELQPATPYFEIRIDGTVVPKHEMTLAAEVPGRVVALGHDVELPGEKPDGAKQKRDESPQKKEDLRAGTYVKKGAVLLRIEPAHYLLEVRRLEAEAEQAKLDVEQLEIEKANQEGLKRIAAKELELAEGELKRLVPLYEQNRITESQKAEGERQVEGAKNALATIDNALKLIPKRRQRLKAAERLAAARLGLAELDLEKTLVKAPISGMVTLLAVEENDFVQRGMPLLKIIDPTVVEVKCSLRTDDLYWLWSGDPQRSTGNKSGRPMQEIPHAKARVIYSVAGEEFFWAGDADGENAPFLSRYETAGLDERTRTVPCRVEVPNPQREGETGPRTLLPKMFVEVVLRVQPQVPLLSIPDKALQPRDQVYTVEDNKLRVHNVRVARAVEGLVLIHQDADSKLKPGQRVVVSPLALAVDGMPVRVAQPAKKASGGRQPLDSEASAAVPRQLQ